MSQRLLRLGILCRQPTHQAPQFQPLGPEVSCVSQSVNQKAICDIATEVRDGVNKSVICEKFFLNICKHRRNIRMLLVCWKAQIICCRARAHTVQYFRQRQPDMTRPGRKIAPVSMYGGVLMILNESAFISFHPGYRSFPSLERGSRSNSISIIIKKKELSEGVMEVCLFPVLYSQLRHRIRKMSVMLCSLQAPSLQRWFDEWR